MESKSKFYSAFLKAQKEMGAAKEDGTNPHFKSKYAELIDVVNAVKNPLNNNGIMFYHSSGQDEHGEYVETYLMHESGEGISTRVYLHIPSNNMQGLGSAITYARRYGLLEITGIPTDDDDGNTSSEQSRTPPKNPPYPDENFDTNFEAWVDAVRAEKTTPEEIIHKIESKHSLTDEQKKKIRIIK